MSKQIIITAAAHLVNTLNRAPEHLEDRLATYRDVMVDYNDVAPSPALERVIAALSFDDDILELSLREYEAMRDAVEADLDAAGVDANVALLASWGLGEVFMELHYDPSP